MLYPVVFSRRYRNHQVTPFRTFLELTRVEAALRQSSIILRAISTYHPKLPESHTQKMLIRAGDDVGLLH